MEQFEKNLPPEESIEEGRAVLIREKTLYHGTGVEDIEQFQPAEETTVGEGVYLTSKKEDAAGYAKRRARSRGGNPVVYEGKIENLKLLELRNDSTVEEILDGFLPILEEKQGKEGLTWVEENVLDTAISDIKAHKVKAGRVGIIARSLGKTFTEYMQSLGYDGLITMEGGEGDDIETHDTYLIFDSEKVHNLSKTPA